MTTKDNATGLRIELMISLRLVDERKGSATAGECNRGAAKTMEKCPLSRGKSRRAVTFRRPSPAIFSTRNVSEPGKLPDGAPYAVARFMLRKILLATVA